MKLEEYCNFHYTLAKIKYNQMKIWINCEIPSEMREDVKKVIDAVEIIEKLIPVEEENNK